MLFHISDLLTIVKLGPIKSHLVKWILCQQIQSCLYEVRNVYKLSKAFKKYTGFDHVGLDWSPCGHPPLDVSDTF